MSWGNLRFFGSGEEQVCLERLADLRKKKLLHCPSKDNLYAALKATPFGDVRVAIIGQDPYPNPSLATGLAFSVPPSEKVPPTLQNIFREYADDLHYPLPNSGFLLKWANQGVLLWNAVLTCEAYKSASHRDWPEWKVLTQELVEKLSPCGVVFVFLGSMAQEYAKFVDQEISHVICLAHPSPRNNINTSLKHPFIGSRVFTTINDRLNRLGRHAIDWHL
jgi:uracil-DNA glycosylase